jgi:hypothetical protein
MKCSISAISSISTYYIQFYPMFGQTMTKRSGSVASVSAIGQLRGSLKVTALQVRGSSIVDLRCTKK